MKSKILAAVLFTLTMVISSQAQEEIENSSICALHEKVANEAPDDAPREPPVPDVVLPKTGTLQQRELNLLFKGYSIKLPAPSVELPGLLKVEGTARPETNVAPDERPEIPERFEWNAAFRQSLVFLSVQHALRLTQSKTVDQFKGPFFRDYLDSIKGIKGWGDGDGWFTNYFGHPAMGAIAGYIQIHNDPKALRLELKNSRAYWKSRLKAMAWSAAYSTQFEIGFFSEATVGNVGKRPGTGGYVDFVVTPTLGTFTIVLEDAADRFIVKHIESRTDNFHLIRLARTFLNPTRSIANLLRFKKPWYRDRVQPFEVGRNDNQSGK